MVSLPMVSLPMVSLAASNHNAMGIFDCGLPYCSVAASLVWRWWAS